MSFAATHLIGFGAGGSAPPATITFTDKTSSSTDSTSYTFSTRSIGSASADRRVIVGVQGGHVSGGPQTVSTVTVAGISASIVVQTNEGPVGSSSIAALAIADVPTGTTGDVVVTFSGGVGWCGICVWATTGVISGTATATASSTADTLSSGSLSVSEGGIAVGSGHTFGNGASRTHTWANLTEDMDDVLEAWTVGTAASAAFASAASPTITCTPSGSLLSSAGVFASFR